MDKLGLEYYDLEPAPGAERITGQRPDGLPDGVHTGGVWRVGDYVYKHTWARPYVNAEYLCPTAEAECLNWMSARYPNLFPKNYRIERIAGLDWVLMPSRAFIDSDISCCR